MSEKWFSSIDASKAQSEQEENEIRQKSRVLFKAEEAVFERSSQRGLFVAPVIRSHLGFKTRVLALDILHLPPGAHCEPKRNPEVMMHILSGSGYSVINGEKFEWEWGDTLFIKPGYWHAHYNLDPGKPAYMLWASIEPLYQSICPMPTIPKGDSYSDVEESYVPPHPFGYEQRPIEMVGNEKWMSKYQLGEQEGREASEKRVADSRTIVRARDVQLERSQHKGDFVSAMVHRYIGFENRVLKAHLQQLPSMSHTETHRHDEAIVYVLKGKGHSIVEGERYDWSAGDCMHVQPNAWHQHFNDEEDGVTQHLCVTMRTLREYVGNFHFEEHDRSGDFTDTAETYIPSQMPKRE